MSWYDAVRQGEREAYGEPHGILWAQMYRDDMENAVAARYGWRLLWCGWCNRHTWHGPDRQCLHRIARERANRAQQRRGMIDGAIQAERH